MLNSIIYNNIFNLIFFIVYKRKIENNNILINTQCGFINQNTWQLSQ